MRIGGFELNLGTRSLRAPDGRVAQLSPLGARLIECLARRPGETMSRNQIVDLLWDGNWLIGDPALHRLASETRGALQVAGIDPALLQTVPRRGYRLLLDTAADGSRPAGEPGWLKAWHAANRSIAIVIGGLILLFALAILARLFR